MISPASLQECLVGCHLLDKISGKHASFDGEKIKGANPKAEGTKDSIF